MGEYKVEACWVLGIYASEVLCDLHSGPPAAIFASCETDKFGDTVNMRVQRDDELACRNGPYSQVW